MTKVLLSAFSLFTLLPSGLAETGTWDLPKAQRQITENFSSDCLIGKGPFEVAAEISLQKLDGTAASVWIGKGVNFGFDGRNGQIFVEGSLVEKTLSLAKTADHLKAGKAFRFFAQRDEKNRLEIGIGESVLYTLPDAGFEVGEIVFRPHRNRMDVLSVRISGDVQPAPKSRPFVVIHDQGQFDCHTTRIPAIARTNDGTLLAVYDLRYNSRKDLQEHMDIGLSRSTDGGKTWEDPRPIMDMGEFGGLPEKQNGCSDPNILVDTETGEIFVSAVWTHGKPGTHQWVGKGSEPGLEPDTSSQFLVVRSTDDGVTWSEPENWTAKLKQPEWYLFAPAPGNGITTRDGTLVMPTQGRDENGEPFSNLMWSRDHGKNWTVSGEARTNTTECAVAELSNGTLMLNMRDNRNRSDKSETNGRAVSVTTDFGKTWTVHSSDHGALPEPVCMASLISHQLADGRRVLFFSNPNSKTARKNMTVRMSFDDGKSWPEEHQILLDHRGGAYSSLVMVDDQTLGILYESSRANLIFQTIPLKDFGLTPTASTGKKPNVLFLAVDDMKDWVNCLGGYEGTVHTPNIDRLAARGMLFSNAHCASPKCAPSRAALMTGLMPSTTGLYDNGHWWLPNFPDVVTLPTHFRANGYRVAGAGKIFHHTAGNHPPNQWDEIQRLVFRDDPWFRGVKLNYPWSDHGPNPEDFPFSGVEGLGHENDWGSLDLAEPDYDDSRTADFPVEFLGEEQDQPFFLACGLFRPHLPWYVPKQYFDLYPIEDIVLPEVKADDLDDIPKAGQAFAKARRGDFETIQKAGKWKQAVQAYLASISYADAQLGRVLDALDESGHADNTVIALWSDHGWHLGEKGHWHKTTLWEEATRVPFIMAVPGKTPGECLRPVSLIDLYPTLNDLCGLPTIASHDGMSLVPLLDDPTRHWDRPAMIQFKRGNAAVRSDRYRYIRYRDGGEELYDLQVDPHEWHNLADNPEHIVPKTKLARWIPETWAESAPTKAQFEFNYESFTWKNKKTGAVVSGAKK